MKSAKQKKVIRALRKLGFREIGGRKELKFVYETDDAFVATVLVTKSRKDIPTGTLGNIRRQTRLDHKSFEGAIKCPFGADDYRKYIARRRLDR